MLVLSPAVLVAAGGLGIAVTTALEVVTAPYSPAVSAYPLNGAVHMVKVVAALVLVAGLVRFAADLFDRHRRVAAGAAGVIALATLMGAVPYSVVEARLSPSLSPAVADAELTAIYEQQVWIGAVGSVAVPLIVLAVVVLAVASLRRRLVPAWAPVASLAAIPVALLAGVVGELGWAFPHPPAWIFLGLSAYGLALLRPPAVVPAGLTTRS